MIVYFLRHVSAGQHGLNSKQDEKRPIDEIGERQSKDIGRALAALGVEVGAVISSPLTRAQQTAELTAKEFGYKGEISIEDAMRPEANVDQFYDLLTQYSKSEAIMVVGHNPSITEFLVNLLTGHDHSTWIDYKKGAVARVEVENGKGILNWMLTPKMARALQTASAKSSRPKTSRK